jgi:hypothetical protein
VTKEKGIKNTTRDKYKLIDKASSLRHDDLMDKVSSHMMNCCDPDCDICDMGQSGSMVDDDEDEEGESLHNKGKRASEGREGVGNLDSAGTETIKASKGDKHNLMKHGEHTSKHPGFKAVASKIASQQGLSRKAAGAILASRTRSASRSAKKANPRLSRVRG